MVPWFIWTLHRFEGFRECSKDGVHMICWVLELQTFSQIRGNRSLYTYVVDVTDSSQNCSHISVLTESMRSCTVVLPVLKAETRYNIHIVYPAKYDR